MARARNFVLLCLALSGSPRSAAADDFEVSSQPAAQPSPAEYPDGNQPQAAAGPEEEEPARTPVPVPLPKKSLRFRLSEDPVRFRHWLTQLCGEPAAPTDSGTRWTFESASVRRFRRANNKTGSLQLLLENYRDLVRFRDQCRQARANDPGACIQAGRVAHPDGESNPSPRPAWFDIGSREFWMKVLVNRAPAGISPRTDLLAASEEEVKNIDLALKKHFYEFLDASELGGKARSADLAEQLLHQIATIDTTCKTRAIAEGSEGTGRVPAQR